MQMNETENATLHLKNNDGTKLYRKLLYKLLVQNTIYPNVFT